MKYFRSIPQLGKVCALVVATLILPALAYAGNGQGGNGQGGNGQGIPVVPEANPVWVLVPFVGAVLLLSSRHLLSPKARKNDA
jgi:hypothetical protein